MYSITIAWFIAEVILQVVLIKFTGAFIWKLWDNTIFFVKLTILSIIRCRVPPFNDTFGIKIEMKGMFKVLVASIIDDKNDMDDNYNEYCRFSFMDTYNNGI